MSVLLAVALACWWGAVGARIEPQAEGELFRPLCTRSCGGEATPETLRFRCSCSPGCALYGDCCHDSPHRNATSWQRVRFACVSVAGRDRYRVVSSCPSGQRSDFCERALGHQPPVTSRVTNVTYGNVFCASCNGDGDDLTTWNVELRCPSEDGEEQRGEESGTRIVYAQQEFWKVDEVRGSRRVCQFHPHFGDYSLLDALELRSCNPGSRVAKCSASWKDAAVAQQCRSYLDPVYFHDTGYQNGHCALCNYLRLEYGDCVPLHVRSALQTDPEAQEYCRERGLEACMRYLKEKTRGRPITLVDLFNVMVSECIPPDCCAGQRYDYRTKRCRKIRGGR